MMAQVNNYKTYKAQSNGFEFQKVKPKTPSKWKSVSQWWRDSQKRQIRAKNWHFSKSAEQLSIKSKEKLSSAGIQYEIIPESGGPKWRDALEDWIIRRGLRADFAAGAEIVRDVSEAEEEQKRREWYMAQSVNQLEPGHVIQEQIWPDYQGESGQAESSCGELSGIRPSHTIGMVQVRRSSSSQTIKANIRHSSRILKSSMSKARSVTIRILPVLPRINTRVGVES